MDQRSMEVLNDLAFDVRRVFHRLRHSVSELHRNAGVSAGMRAVLDNLIANGPQSVPHLARQRPVSRQHIQVQVNALLAAGLVALRDNPAHKRSPLIAATDQGRQLFESLLARETKAFSAFECPATPEEMAAAAKVLARLATALDRPGWHATVNRMAEEATRP